MAIPGVFNVFSIEFSRPFPCQVRLSSRHVRLVISSSGIDLTHEKTGAIAGTLQIHLRSEKVILEDDMVTCEIWDDTYVILRILYVYLIYIYIYNQKNMYRMYI